MYKIMMSLLGMLLLAGCATTANYQQVVSQWQGQKAQDLVATWGYPDASVKLPNGNTVYTYTRQQLYTTPAYGPQLVPAFSVVDGSPRYGVGVNGVVGATQTVSLSCRTWFEANPKGIIVNTQFQGNNCVASKKERDGVRNSAGMRD